MTSPRPNPEDPTSSMTSTMTYTFPLLTIIWGGIFPSGLILYWIVYTAYLVVQQYLIMGWGNLFPLFGWQPSWAPSPEPAITPASRPKRAEADRCAGEQPLPTPTPAPPRRAAAAQPAAREPAAGRRQATRPKAMTFREFTGKNVEEAIRAAMAEFSADLGDLDIEILSQGSRGILGVGGEEARILAAPKSAVDAAETVRAERGPDRRPGRAEAPRREPPRRRRPSADVEPEPGPPDDRRST